jgi:aldehyde dehydrogenase (NAD+)
MDVRAAWASVDKWAKTEKAPFSVNGFPLRPVIYKEPKGVVLIISPFNYPVWLCISPIVRSILRLRPSFSLMLVPLSF